MRGPRVVEIVVALREEDTDQRTVPEDLLSAWSFPSTEATRTTSRSSVPSGGPWPGPNEYRDEELCGSPGKLRASSVDSREK